TGETVGQGTGVLGRVDVDELCGEHGAGIETLVEADDGDPGHGVTRHQGPGDGGRSPPAREQGEVEVEDAVCGYVEHLGPEDAPVGDDHPEVEGAVTRQRL